MENDQKRVDLKYNIYYIKPLFTVMIQMRTNQTGVLRQSSDGVILQFGPISQFPVNYLGCQHNMES